MTTRYDRRRHGIHNVSRQEVIADPLRYVDAIAELGPLFFDEVGQVWVCSGYPEASRVLTDHRRFSSARTHDIAGLRERGLDDAAEVAEIISEQLLFTDPPKHSELRGPLREEFTRSAALARDDQLKAIADAAVEDLPADGEFDLITDFAAHLPPALVASLLGMDGREKELTRWADGYERLIGSLSSLPHIRDRDVVPTLREAMTALREEVRRRARCPAGDLISAMTGNLPETLGFTKDREHVVAANCLVLLAGGYQTLTHLVSTGLLLLADHPDQLARLRGDPALIDGAIDEFLRIAGSSQYVARRATENVEIGSTRIAAGDTVIVHLGAANLDPRVFDRPRTLDITRRGPRHLGFGLGRHYCAGAPLAERLARWAILGFLQRFPHYRRAGDLIWGRHANTRCPAAAPVRAGEPVAGTEPGATPTRLSDFDRYRQLIEWNDTATQLGPHQCWHHLVERWALLAPDTIAVEDEHGALSYVDLDRRANGLAAALRARNVQPETVVAVAIGRSADTAIAVLAIAKAGGAFLLIDPDGPAERLRHTLLEAGTDLVLAAPDTAPRLRELGLPAPVLEPHTTARADRPPMTGVGRGNTAYLVFTSGTTGKPKGIAIDHEGVVNLHVGQRQVLRTGPGDRVLQFLSHSFDGCVFELLLGLATGATLVFAPPARLVAGPPLLRTLRERRITTAVLTPSVWAALPDDPLPELRVACAAGERLPAPVTARWGAPGRRFLNLYGPAETAVWATWHEVGDPRFAPPIGRPVPNKRVYVLDDELRPLGIGQQGELCIGGLGVGRYLSRPGLMEQRFAVDPFGVNTGELLYRTGDLGRRLADGSLEFLGRRDRQIKIRGQRVELDEIERVLETAPGVREGVVAEQHGRLAATVVPTTDGLDEAAVRKHLAKHLHAGMVPSTITITPQLPLTPVGKRDQPPRSVAEPPKPQVDTATLARAHTILTWRVARIFADCLRVPAHQVKADADFFTIGGDSLALATLIGKTEEELDTELDVDGLLNDPTPDGVASTLLGEGAGPFIAKVTERAIPAQSNGESTVDEAEPLPVTEFATTGDPGNTVLLVHGTMDRAASFAGVAAGLGGWSVLGYDRRGWAGARALGGPELTLRDHVDDLLRLLPALSRPVVAGHSYGALVALGAAARRPDLVGAVVAYEPPLRWFPWWPADEAWQRVVADAREHGPAEVARALFTAVTGRAPANLTPRELAEDGAAVLTEMTDPEVDTPSFDPLAIAVPVLAAAGARSLPHHQTAARKLAELVPEGRFEEVPGARHIGHVTHPAKFAALIERTTAEARR